MAIYSDRQLYDGMTGNDGCRRLTADRHVFLTRALYACVFTFTNWPLGDHNGILPS